MAGGWCIWGVPFETVVDAAVRAGLMREILGFLLREDPLADADGDGVVALVERVFGRSPEFWEPGPGLDVVRDEGGVSVRFPRSQILTGVRIVVEMAESLDGAWTAVAEAEDWQPMVALDGGVEIDEQFGAVLGWVELTVGGEWRFARLRVEER